MKFKTKPFEIEAERFTGDPQPFYGMCGWKFAMLPEYDRTDDPECIAQVFDELHNTWVGVKEGQWIIKGMKGEFYLCDNEIFEAKYEAVPDYSDYEPYFDSDFPETQ